MTEEERNWWEELADQYEAWAYDPPPKYTCGILQVQSKWGFKYTPVFSETILKKVWRDRYGPTDLPAGSLHCDDMNARRSEFCWYMAETIREAIGEE